MSSADGVQHAPVTESQTCPAAQDVASQAHFPPLHVGVDPLHAVHALPPLPQAPALGCASHVAPLQQPLGHDVESHTHAPLVGSHRCPAEHDVALHTHAPLAPHAGVAPMHAAQAAPPAPHVPPSSAPSAMHDEPLQHPLHSKPPQVHAPEAHDWPLMQGAQAAPPLPHDVSDCAV